VKHPRMSKIIEKNVYKNTLTLKCMNSESISKTDGSPTAIASPDVLIIITKD